MESLRGIFTPLVTPLRPDETLDLESLRRLVEFQIENGIHGLWAMGTTGEFAAFDEDERFRAIECTVASANGRVPTIANVSDASTRLVLRHVKRAEEAGAVAIAATPPYYFPHSQSELLTHFRTIAASTRLPLLIYNIPQTVRVAVALKTVTTLAEEGTVMGIKDSQNDLEWFRELTLAMEGRMFASFAGTRHLIDAAVLAGAVGAIPSIANARPDLCVSVFEAAAKGDFEVARGAQAEIVRLEAGVEVGQGSRNGATIGSLKAVLHAKGVLNSVTMTKPLQPD
jgi:4-hydroxy-tetrahydrodipicolinate synthase